MKKHLVNIWGDVVNTKELLIAILIIGFLTMVFHIIAPQDNKTLGLFLGLLGAVIGFIITVFLFKPKRIITTEEGDDE